MIAADTSVVIAAFAPWHEHHETARAALAGTPYLPDHCSIEVYATLTRLPHPFRVPGVVAVEYLDRRFGDRRLVLPAERLRELPARLAALEIVGGATYDALVAATATAHRALIRTLDRRAERIYRALGADYELLVGV